LLALHFVKKKSLSGFLIVVTNEPDWYKEIKPLLNFEWVVVSFRDPFCHASRPFCEEAADGESDL
jgi:hypothetical protein